MVREYFLQDCVRILITYIMNIIKLSLYIKTGIFIQLGGDFVGRQWSDETVGIP